MILPVWLWMMVATAAPCGTPTLCSCVDSTPEQLYENAEVEAVFRGVVVEVGERTPGSVRPVPVTLRVTGHWKGVVAPTFVVRDHPLCSVGFEAGKEYVVYAERDEGGALTTSICLRTRSLARAAGDVPVLDRLARERQHRH